MFSDAALAALTAPVIIVLMAGGFVGGLASGGAGFAFAVVAASVWLHVIDPIHTAFLIVSCGTLLQLVLVWKMRRTIEPGRLLPFLIAGFAGVPIGVWLLTRTDANSLKQCLGIFIFVFGVYALARPAMHKVKGGGRLADALIGFIGGVLGGVGGYSGVVPTIWTQLRGWPKDVARGVYQPFILAMHVATLLGVGIVAFDPAGIAMFAITLPIVLAGGWVGWIIYGRLDERQFRQMLALLLVVSGLTLIV